MRYLTPTPNPSPIKRERLIWDTSEVEIILGNVVPRDIRSITLENSPSLILGEGAWGWGL